MNFSNTPDPDRRRSVSFACAAAVLCGVEAFAAYRGHFVAMGGVLVLQVVLFVLALRFLARSRRTHGSHA